jgi:hypothetical protein
MMAMIQEVNNARRNSIRVGRVVLYLVRTLPTFCRFRLSASGVITDAPRYGIASFQPGPRARILHASLVPETKIHDMLMMQAPSQGFLLLRPTQHVMLKLICAVCRTCFSRLQMMNLGSRDVD